MGFCGCSLQASVVSAGVYGIVCSIYAICWTSGVISILSRSVVADSLLYYSYLSFTNIQFLRGDKAIMGLVVFSLILHIVWLVISALLIRGNETKKPTYLYMWIPISSIILISDLGSLIYCIAKAVQKCDMLLRPGYLVIDDTSTLAQPCGIYYFAYLLVGVLFIKAGLISIGIQIALTIYVSNRAQEIKNELMHPRQIAVLSPVAGYVIPAQQHYAVGQQPNLQPGSHVFVQGSNQPNPQYTGHVINAHGGVQYTTLPVGENPAFQEFHSLREMKDPRY